MFHQVHDEEPETCTLLIVPCPHERTSCPYLFVLPFFTPIHIGERENKKGEGDMRFESRRGHKTQ